MTTQSELFRTKVPTPTDIYNASQICAFTQAKTMIEYVTGMLHTLAPGWDGFSAIIIRNDKLSANDTAKQLTIEHMYKFGWEIKWFYGTNDDEKSKITSISLTPTTPVRTK